MTDLVDFACEHFDLLGVILNLPLILSLSLLKLLDQLLLLLEFLVMGHPNVRVVRVL